MKAITHIVVASDSFKGSLTSPEVAEAIHRGVKEVSPSARVVKLNVADGGEGTMEALIDALGGKRVKLCVSDPLGRPINTFYGLSDGQTAIMEMASASGLPLLKAEERNPLHTSTYGTGEMIADALRRGCRKIYIGIGGSATNDGGMGMLSALGYRFYDASGRDLSPCGARLEQVERIDASGVMPEMAAAEFVVACDVDNPFYGPRGATRVFAPQKGATPEEVLLLERGMRHYADKVFGATGVSIAHAAGAGAAGGVGGAFLAFLKAKLTPGIEMVLDALRFDEVIANASLVITGEGRMDRQTAMGKTPAGVLKRAKAKGIPVIAIGGSVEHCPELEALGFKQIAGITPAGMPLEVAMQPDVAARNLSATTASILRQLQENTPY